MDTADELVECLRRKGCPLTVARLADELKKAPQVIEANLGVLRRAGVVQILRPGEWELAPEKHATEPITPPEPAAAIALSRPLVPPASTDQPVAGTRAFTPYSRLTPPPKPAATPDHQEKTMSFKTCDKCEQKKGPRAFAKGDPTCSECRGTNKAKPKGGGPDPEEENQRRGEIAARDPREACQAERDRALRRRHRAPESRPRCAARRRREDRRRDRADPGARLT